MADTMRWRYGETNPVLVPVDDETVIEIGDLVYLETDDARPASAQGEPEGEGDGQELFHDHFLGVAMQRSRSGDSQPIRVATTGVFEFTCATATFEVGDADQVAEAVGGAVLEDQQVAGVATANLAIGRCAHRVAPASTRVLVDIVSTVMRGGPQSPE